MSRKNKKGKPWQGGVGFARHAYYGGNHKGVYTPIQRIRPKMPHIAFTCTKTASEKLKFWIDRSSGEFGGFGITGDAEQRFLITDFVLVPQRTGTGHADLDNGAIADYYYDMVKKGLQPHQFGRIWFHTHLGSSGWVRPSGDDDNTFAKAFTDGDWAMMLVLNQAYCNYAELYTAKGESHYFQIVFKFWEKPLTAQKKKWADEYDGCVKKIGRIYTPPVYNSPVTQPPQKTGLISRIKSGTEKLHDYLSRIQPDGIGLSDDELAYLQATEAGGLTQAETNYLENLERKGYWDE